MEMKQITEMLGVTDYPESFDVICAQLANDTDPACDLALIDEAQEKYEAFGKYYDIVREGAQQINEDPVCSIWVKVVHTYITNEKWGHYRDVPVPPLNGTPKQDMLMLATLIPFIPVAAEKYAKGGFSHEEIASYLQAYGSCMGSTKIRTGYVGLDETYFRWLNLFARAKIFRTHGIQFEFTKLKDFALYLRNKCSGQVIPVRVSGVVHASGKMMLGAGGYEDPEGAFEVSFAEDDEKFRGHGVFDAVISREAQDFPKTEWECVARPGARCLGMHLPRGANITRENVRLACAEAYKIARRIDPDFTEIPIQCSSWLLDPGIEKILGPDSNVVRFGKLFARHPGKSPGRAANSFVFPGKPQRDEDLPEETRLQRGLKQHYLNGGYTYGYTGILVL